jgi:DnaJ-domain-containing protein 1
MNFLNRAYKIFMSNVSYNHKARFTNNHDPIKKERTDKSIYSKMEQEYYANLELVAGASFEQIKVAYKKLLKKYHPDLYHQDKEKKEYANKIAIKLNEAFNYFEKKFEKEMNNE